MDIIELARELGKSIQADDRYINFRVASQNNDEDKELQNLIGGFNLIKINIDNEESKAVPDEQRLKRLKKELQEAYKVIMDNKNMIAFNEAKIELDKLIKEINAIIRGAINGEDPLKIEPEYSGCAGDCSNCRGCR